MALLKTEHNPIFDIVEEIDKIMKEKINFWQDLKNIKK